MSSRSIKDLMNRPITISKNANLVDVISVLLTHKISRVIIGDVKNPEGIISEKDVLNYLYKEKLQKKINEVSASEIMHDIFFMNPSSSIIDAAKFMIDNKCSSVAVGTAKDFQGIVTKTDLTKFYGENYPGKYEVSNHMSVSYFSSFDNDSIYEVIKTMLGFGISRIIITNQSRKPVGIVSTGNVLRTALEIQGSESTKKFLEPSFYKEFWTRYGEFCARPADLIMSKNILMIKEEEDLATACRMIIEKEINALGVEDSKGELGGIIGKRDVLLAYTKLE